MAISGDTVVLGAYLEDSSNQENDNAHDSGAAYVFVRNGTKWTQQAYLKASNTRAGDWFGVNVAISGDTLVVSSVLEDSNATGVNGDAANNFATDSGAVYIFTGVGPRPRVTIVSDDGGGYFIRLTGVPGGFTNCSKVPRSTEYGCLLRARVWLDRISRCQPANRASLLPRCGSLTVDVLEHFSPTHVFGGLVLCPGTIPSPTRIFFTSRQSNASISSAMVFGLLARLAATDFFF